MKSALTFLAACILLATAASGATPTADAIMSQAKAKASAEQKAIFVHFGASWCVWCKHLDAYLERPDIKPVFERHFVPVKLVVQENEKNKGLENAGADALMKDWGGPAGLPYSVFLDAKGGVIVNSKLKGENIGYPAQPEEIAHFISMMKQAAPKIPADDLKKLESVLKEFKASR